MTIKHSIAAIAVVSSAVLFFSQPAHAQQVPSWFTPPQPPAAPQMPAMPQMPQMPAVQMPTPPAPAYPQPAIQVPQPPAFAPQALPPAAQPVQAPIQAPVSNTQSQPASKPAAASTSNTYVNGTCTWYAKNRRTDLPNRLGNGGQWVKNAAKLGYKTGSTPQAGAIGEQPGHVVYVESVNKNNTITVSEMNYGGKRGVVHKRTVKASTFKYIY